MSPGNDDVIATYKIGSVNVGANIIRDKVIDIFRVTQMISTLPAS